LGHLITFIAADTTTPCHRQYVVVVVFGCVLRVELQQNPEHHGHMKHLDLRFFWLHNIVTAGQIVLRYIPTADMAADFLTKGLARVKVAAAIAQLGLTAP
jgi:hypothetical protein